MTASPPDTPRIVPPYVVTQGRTRPRNERLAVETLVVRRPEADLSTLRFESADIADLCAAPVSVAELAARCEVPLGVARVLVGDLADDDVVDIADRPTTVDGDVLGRLIAHVRSL